MVIDNLGLVGSLAAKYYKKLGYSYDEVFQAGAVGLIVAARNYNPEKNCKFSTYAYWNIFGYIMNLCRSDTWNGANREERFKGHHPLSLNNECTMEDGQPTEFINLVEDPEDKYERSELQLLLNKLTDEERFIVTKYYLEGYFQREIAEELNCSQNKISVVLKKSLLKLRNMIEGDV